MLHPDGISPQGLTRTAEIDGDRFFLEEWLVIRVESFGFATALASSSARAEVQSQAHAAALLATPGVQLGRRYLMIEAARHIEGLVEPLIRLESLRTGKPASRNLADGRVTFRASISPHGVVEDVRVLEGASRVARALARDLRVDHPLSLAHGQGHRDEHHRSVVFATFEVIDGEAQLVSAVPILPQCCGWPY